MSKGPALYRINLVRELREREKKAEKQRSLASVIGLSCFGLFLIAILYSGFTILNMETVLRTEKSKVERLTQEYHKYTATQLIVDKSDIELLDNLQGRGIFWTRKLAAMAKYLPENYWITRFNYNNEELRVSGFGYVTSKQDELLILDAYLNRLRSDSTFSDIFKNLHLNSTVREGERGAGKVAFDFSATTKKWKAP